MVRVNDIRASSSGVWIPDIYEAKVRSERSRSRTLDIPARENDATIQYTLLGIELKVGKRRFECPDLATARYLRVFARFGCTSFAIPYDITRISVIADEMETAWQTMLLIIDAQTRGISDGAKSRLRGQVLRSMRDEISEIGAGPAMPEFERKTAARKP